MSASVPMRWTTQKLGAGMCLSGDTSTISRTCSSGHSVQLGDTWLSRDITTIAMCCSEVTEDTFIGVVGRNFYPSSWEVSLAECSHAVSVNAREGRVTHKGSNTNFVLVPFKSGAKIQLVIDMQLRELTIELLGDDPGVVVSSMVVEGIPHEVTLGVSFGPGRSSISIVNSKTEKPELRLEGKMHMDLWDDANVIKPLTVGVMNHQPSALKEMLEEQNVALSLVK